MSGEHPMVVSFLDVDPFPQVQALIALNTVVWPHTTDPRDSGDAVRVTVRPGGGMDEVSLELPATGGASLRLPYGVTGEYPVKVWATDAGGAEIAETVLERTITPGNLVGPELPPGSPRAKVQPERPHFAWPFRRSEGGGAYTVEQSSQDHIYGQQYALVVTPLGWRPERPEYGWPWPEFSTIPLDLDPLRLALRRFVPDANVVVEEWADVASQAIRHIRFDDPNPNRMS